MVLWYKYKWLFVNFIKKKSFQQNSNLIGPAPPPTALNDVTNMIPMKSFMKWKRLEVFNLSFK